VHFGLFYPGKGVETLLQAVRLLREHGTAFRLFMIGGLWPGAERYYEQLRALATAYQLDRWVHWIGYCPAEEVSAYLLASDLCVLPYDDGISSRRGSLMAALAHRVPVISTHPSIPSAYFKDGENVSLVPPRHPEALRDRILELMRAPQSKACLGQNGARLLQVFSWPRIGQQTLELYAQVSRSRTA
jgi:glycosyltransferase involved in cell wall biosynthesis